MTATSAGSTIPAPDLPPAYRLVRLQEQADATAHAIRLAPREGAGAFVLVERFDVLDFAVVLEPQDKLVLARRALFAGMAAIADALASHAPPQKAVTFTFPASVHVDGGRLGGARLASPQDCAEDEVPDWLVFGAMLLAVPVGAQDPGLDPDATFLVEEGFAPEVHPAVVASFARHLMVAFDAWAERGFGAVANAYLAFLPKESPGDRRAIDDNGDLLIRRFDRDERVPFLPALEREAWFDPATGRPRLRA